MSSQLQHCNFLVPNCNRAQNSVTQTSLSSAPIHLPKFHSFPFFYFLFLIKVANLNLNVWNVSISQSSQALKEIVFWPTFYTKLLVKRVVIWQFLIKCHTYTEIQLLRPGSLQEPFPMKSVRLVTAAGLKIILFQETAWVTTKICFKNRESLSPWYCWQRCQVIAYGDQHKECSNCLQNNLIVCASLSGCKTLFKK